MAIVRERCRFDILEALGGLAARDAGALLPLEAA
jgi:hypothetical protein